MSTHKLCRACKVWSERRSGRAYGNWAMRGSDYCRVHGGMSPRASRAVLELEARRKEAFKAGLARVKAPPVPEDGGE